MSRLCRLQAGQDESLCSVPLSLRSQRRGIPPFTAKRAVVRAVSVSLAAGPCCHRAVSR